MPWKENYTRSDEKSLDDSEIVWPHGNRVCATITVDLSVATSPNGLAASDFQTAPAMFGLHEGTDLVLSLLGQFGLKATFAVPGAMARILQPTLRRIQDAGHEVAANGFRHEDVSALSRDDEKDHIALASELISTATGARPSGWFSLPRPGDRYDQREHGRLAAGGGIRVSRQRFVGRHSALLGK